MKILNFIKNSCFVKSFKELDKRLAWVIASELSLIISVFIILIFSSLFLKTSLNSLGISNEFMEEINKNLNNETFAMNFLQGQMRYIGPEKFQAFLAKISSNILFSLIIIILLICFFKSFEWSKIIRKKFTKIFFFRYLGLFLIWNILWVVLFFIIALGFKNYAMRYAVTIWFICFAYFSFLVYPMFTKEKKIFKSIKKTFKTGLTCIYKLILPLINIWILLQLSYLIFIILSKIPVLASSFFVLFVLFYISWIKFYMYKVIENVI